MKFTYDAQTIAAVVVIIFVIVLIYFAFKDKINIGSGEKKSNEDAIIKKNRELATQINSLV